MNYVTGSKAFIFVRKTQVMELGYSLTQAAARNILALIRRKI